MTVAAESAQQQPMAVQERPTIDVELSNPAFCGPLGLLLELIERRRLPIAEVSLADVADQYLERMRTLVGLDPELLADFLVIAAKLLVIKSRELLPTSAPLPEELDVAAELQQRLVEYRIFKEAAGQLRLLEESGHRSYPRQSAGPGPSLPEPPLEPVPPDVLRDAMVRMLKALRAEEAPLALAPRVSVEERIQFLLDCISSRGFAVFSEVAGRTVGEVVATFLALLELLRRDLLAAVQESPFAEIRVSRLEPPGGPPDGSSPIR